MKVTIQIDSIAKLKEIIQSKCEGIRFGSEFCMWKIPSHKMLKKAYELITENGKEFTYITPKVTNANLALIRKHLSFLNQDGDHPVVINDFGVLNLLQHYPKLRPQLGRQLVYIPSRCPWLTNALNYRGGFFERRRLERIYNQTSLNYQPSIELYQKKGIKRVDVDWIPQAFQYFDYLVQKKLRVSIYSHLIPVGITRACHTARFLGVSQPMSCPQPCNTKAFLLKQQTLGLDLYLLGNVAFRFQKHSRVDFKKLSALGVDELIVPLNPITKMDNQKTIDEFITNIKA